MPALNFTQFVDKVESGAKCCTIRARRKRPIRVGDVLHLFTGMRTARCRRLGVAACCRAEPIEISGTRVVLNGKALSPARLTRLAREDGFATAADLLRYFNQHPLRNRSGVFVGDWIVWAPPLFAR
jgi:hypothetical protein